MKLPANAPLCVPPAPHLPPHSAPGVSVTEDDEGRPNTANLTTGASSSNSGSSSSSTSSSSASSSPRAKSPASALSLHSYPTLTSPRGASIPQHSIPQASALLLLLRSPMPARVSMSFSRGSARLASPAPMAVSSRVEHYTTEILGQNNASELVVALHYYVPRPVIALLEASTAGFTLDVNVVFVNITKLDVTRQDALSNIQKSIYLAQLCIYRFEGTLKEFSMDDKGCVLVIVFGLPPFRHDPSDDCERAAQLAATLQNELQAIGLDCAIGIGTGPAFVGAFGCPHRRELALAGGVLVRAARLMVAALKMDHDRPKVLMDRNTCYVLNSPLFELGPTTLMLTLKGFQHPLEVFEISHFLGGGMTSDSTTSPFIGRRVILEFMTRLLRDFAHGVTSDSAIVLAASSSSSSSSSASASSSSLTASSPAAESKESTATAPHHRRSASVSSDFASKDAVHGSRLNRVFAMIGETGVGKTRLYRQIQKIAEDQYHLNVLVS